MGQIISKKKLKEYAQKGIDIPEFLDELNPYELKELHHHIREDISNINWAVEMQIKINRSYDYPENTTPFNYWIDAWDQESGQGITYRDRIQLWNNIQKRLNEDQTNETKLPDAETVAKKFCSRKNNKSGQYGPEVVKEALKIVRKYIRDNKLTSIHRKVRTISKEVQGHVVSLSEVDLKTIDGWVKFYWHEHKSINGAQAKR